MGDGELYIDSPYLRRVRAEGVEQGLEQGLERGLERGREEGLRQAILSALLTRFDLTGTAYVRIERRLARARGEDELGLLLEAAIVAESVVDFEETLQATVPAERP